MLRAQRPLCLDAPPYFFLTCTCSSSATLALRLSCSRSLSGSGVEEGLGGRAGGESDDSTCMYMQRRRVLHRKSHMHILQSCESCGVESEATRVNLQLDVIRNEEENFLICIQTYTCFSRFVASGDSCFLFFCVRPFPLFFFGGCVRSSFVPASIGMRLIFVLCFPAHLALGWNHRGLSRSFLSRPHHKLAGPEIGRGDDKIEQKKPDEAGEQFRD